MWGSLLLSKSFSKSLLLSKSFSKSLSEVLSSSLPQKRISAVDIEVGQQQKSDSSTFENEKEVNCQHGNFEQRLIEFKSN